VNVEGTPAATEVLGEDTFNVAPSSENLIGVLNVLLPPGGPGAGEWSFGNRQPVSLTHQMKRPRGWDSPFPVGR
jgi:hypothetical protein